jgi:hypothetical protein
MAGDSVTREDGLIDEQDVVAFPRQQHRKWVRPRTEHRLRSRRTCKLLRDGNLTERITRTRSPGLSDVDP